MTNDQYDPRSDTGPVFDRDPAPDHGPDFWHRVDAAVASTTPESTRAMPAAAARTAAPIDRGAGAPRFGGGPVTTPPPSRSFVLPVAIAAALLVVAGLAVVVLNRDGSSDATTELVAGPTETPAATSLDGPANDETGEPGETGDTAAPTPTTVAATAGTTDSTDTSDTTDTTGTSGSTPAPSVAPAATTAPAGTGGADATAVPAAPTPEPRPTVPPIPDFASAVGAVGSPEYVPLDQGLPAESTYLANWSERALTFYAVDDPGRSCASAQYSEVRYVNGSGFTTPARDPQPRFSGEISHFTVQDGGDRAAFVVSCGTQLEMYVADLEPNGRFDKLTLAWFGEGVVESALVFWDGPEVDLSAIEPGADAFSVAYDVETGLLSRNGGPSRIMLEAGAPAERSLTPLAATSDAGLTYWAGRADPGTVSACPELYGSGQSDMLWLRQGEGQWRPAVAGEFPIGTVTAAAIEPEHLQFAFADVCPDQAGRVVIGTQLPDGRIGDPVVLDLTPYVPGHAAQLWWVDADTLRIETDNEAYGFGVVRFDYRLDDQIVLQID